MGRNAYSPTPLRSNWDLTRAQKVDIVDLIEGELSDAKRQLEQVSNLPGYMTPEEDDDWTIMEAQQEVDRLEHLLYALCVTKKPKGEPPE